MKTYDVKCPYCGKLNRGIYLEETGGWMECEYCLEISHTTGAEEKPYRAGLLIPSLHMAVSS